MLEDRPDLAPTVAKLVQDHNMIGQLIRDLERALQSGENPDILLRHLDGIDAVMETHFRFEEKQLVGLLDAVDAEGLDRVMLFGPIA